MSRHSLPPLRKVVDVDLHAPKSDPYTFWEKLECGHSHRTDSRRDRLTKKRRCHKCLDAMQDDGSEEAYREHTAWT